MNPSKRLLVVSYEYPPLGGGGAKVVEGLVTRFLNRGMAVDLLTMGYKDLPRYEEHGALRIYRTPSIRRNQTVCAAYEMIPYLLFAIPKALRLARQNDYVINHTHFIYPDGLISSVVKLFTNLRFVTTAHGSDVPGYNPNRFKLLHILLRPIWQLVTGRIDRVICPSDHIRKLIHAANPNVDAVVIPNGIDPDRFSPMREKKCQLLSVTRIFERKGVQYLIEAFNRNARPGWTMKVVGDGPYLEELERLAEGHLNVELLGFLENDSDELKELYETSAIFSLPSASENFPIVLLEAMIAGAAVITTEGTGCADVVGGSAELVTPRDVDQLAESLARLMDDEEYRVRCGREGRERAESLFAWERVVDKHLELFEQVADE